MVSDAERMARAGEYVLGRMSEAERERAERDLEIDERFRAAVVAVAERMRYFGSGGNNPAKLAAAEAMWSGLAQRLAALPHMQGAKLEQTLSGSPGRLVARRAAPEAERVPGAPGPSWWQRMKRGASRLLRRRPRRDRAPQAVAVLEAALIGPCAIVELHREGRLRLLLLGEWALGANEQLSLWGVRDDGAVMRVGGFGQGGQIWLEASPDARHTAFLLGREGISFFPASRMVNPPLAEGKVRQLAGTPGAKGAGNAPDPLAAAGR